MTFVTLSSSPPPFGVVNASIFVTIPLLRCFWDVTFFLASGWCILSLDYRNHRRFFAKDFLSCYWEDLFWFSDFCSLGK